jgi:hypothetical protein
MGYQWVMVKEEEADVTQWLQKNWEPFAVTPTSGGGHQVWLKRHVFAEDDEPKSSTKPENRVAQD